MRILDRLLFKRILKFLIKNIQIKLNVLIEWKTAGQKAYNGMDRSGYIAGP